MDEMLSFMRVQITNCWLANESFYIESCENVLLVENC